MLNIKPLRTEWVTLLASLYLLIGMNVFLWQHLEQVVPPGLPGLWLTLAFAVLMLFAFNLILTLIAFRYVLKPLLVLLFVSGAAVAYFMNRYGVLIDAGMFANIAETNVTEVRDLLSLKFALYILGLGVLPSVLLWRAPVVYRPWQRELFGKLVVTAACVVGLGSVGLANYQGLSSLFRNHHELRLMLTPSNIVGASMAYVSERVVTSARPFAHYGEDAARTPDWQHHQRKSLTVLVVGESARADHFGVLGYNRDTTPRLAAEQGLLAFSDVHSCGTETAVSVPCMFSGMPRKAYDARVAKNREGLLDILERAGLDVQWRDNQSGCKGTCDRVQFINMSKLKDPQFCAEGECHDEILLQGLGELIDHLDKDTVLVLHQMGSHGPAYTKRSLPSQKKFQPECLTSALQECTREQVVNAYDNSIVSTDHFLNSTIRWLEARSGGAQTAMVYLADHGESLGEGGIYLHGMPYAIAPDVQKHVPWITWLSPAMQQRTGIATACLQKDLRSRHLTHDNYFHSVLGLMDVRTGVYEAAQDMYAGCRQAGQG